MKVLLAADGRHCTKRRLSCIAAHDDLLGPAQDCTLLGNGVLGRCTVPVLLIR